MHTNQLAYEGVSLFKVQSYPKGLYLYIYHVAGYGKYF